MQQVGGKKRGHMSVGGDAKKLNKGKKTQGDHGGQGAKKGEGTGKERHGLPAKGKKVKKKNVDAHRTS